MAAVPLPSDLNGYSHAAIGASAHQLHYQYPALHLLALSAVRAALQKVLVELIVAFFVNVVRQGYAEGSTPFHKLPL